MREGAKVATGELFVIDGAAEADMPRILEIERESISPPWTHGALLGEMYREDSFFRSP